MAILSTDSSFQSWILSPQEINQGSILTSAQKQCIQNQIVQYAERKLNLTFNSLNPSFFIQEEAEIRGAIDALKYLISLSEEFEIKTGQRIIKE